MKDLQTGGARFVHAGACVSSADRARIVFEDVFGLECTKDFEAPAELINTLFGFDEPVRILVYDAGPAAVEVFVCEQAAGRAQGFSHLCLEFPDREQVLARALDAGFGVRRHARADGSFIVFVQDPDGNLFEIK